MDIQFLKEITKWFKKTDLVELIYRKNNAGFELKEQTLEAQIGQSTCVLEPIISPGVGIYRAAEPGKTPNFKEGMLLKIGDLLGYVEMVNDKKLVTSHTKGYLKTIAIEDGKPVHYGQPLFYIEPK
ncbi:MAG TPA: biotin/lipoyl-containing protein [Elusimicrobiales bacterium]|nr:biotin/lipoyl-containing protein [Elusimicrobiales bacterium]